MRSNFRRTADWLKACGKQPSPENLSVQIGCHLEEFAEFIEAVDFSGVSDTKASLVLALNGLANDLKKNGLVRASISISRREDALDALCDAEVTGNGVAYLAGFNKEAADDAVISSNEAKLVDGKPVFLPGGKIGKPDGWRPPNLKNFV